jgi:hypothetical protein
MMYLKQSNQGEIMPSREGGSRAKCPWIWIVFALVVAVVVAVLMAGWSQKTVPLEIDELKEYTWFNGDREEHVFAALDEVAIFPRNVSETVNIKEKLVRSFDPQADLIKDYESVILIRLPNRLDIAAIENKMAGFQNTTGNSANFVFYRGPKKDQAPMTLTGEIIVHFRQDWNETKIAKWTRGMGLEMVKSFPFSPNTYLFKAGPGLRSLEMANQIYLSGQVIYAYPNWWKTMELKIDQVIPDDKNISLRNKILESSKKVHFTSNIVLELSILLIIHL